MLYVGKRKNKMNNKRKYEYRDNNKGDRQLKTMKTITVLFKPRKV